MWSQPPVFRCPYCGRLCVLATIDNQCDDGALVRCPSHPTKNSLDLLPGHDKALDSE